MWRRVAYPSSVPEDLTTRQHPLGTPSGTARPDSSGRGSAPRVRGRDGGASETSLVWTENRAEGAPLLQWREVWSARELVIFFALRDFRVRYKQAVVGLAWVVLQPLVTVAAFTLAFERIGSVASYGLPYPVFALAGLLG